MTCNCTHQLMPAVIIESQNLSQIGEIYNAIFSIFFRRVLLRFWGANISITKKSGTLGIVPYDNYCTQELPEFVSWYLGYIIRPNDKYMQKMTKKMQNEGRYDAIIRYSTG